MENDVKNNISLYDAANFLVQLFYCADTNYYCPRSKIEKLLSIADMFYMVKAEKALFEENICVNTCGTGFSQLISYLPDDIGDIVSRDSAGNDVKTERLSMEAINPKSILAIMNGPHIPSIFRVNTDSIPVDIQELIINVFKNFGSCESIFLGEKLDEFKDKISTVPSAPQQKRYIDASRVRTFFADNPNKENEIIRFILEGNNV